MGAALEVIEGGMVGEVRLREHYAARLNDLWHGTREKIVALGDLLIEASRQLGYEQFNAMLGTDLDFTRDHALRYMRIAQDVRLSGPSSRTALPEGIQALDALRRLNDNEFEAAIASGGIRADMTVREAQQLVREIKQRSATAYVHRPLSNKCRPPTRPGGANAQTYPELVYLLIEARKARGLSQAALDDLIGWAEGQASKYEIPHQDDGRISSGIALLQWMQGLGLGLSLVPLR